MFKMKKNLTLIIIGSIIAGIVISLITGLFSNNAGFSGSGRWGYPLHWLSKMLVGPQYTAPLEIVWLNLVYDIIIWSFIILLILLIAFRKKMIEKEK